MSIIYENMIWPPMTVLSHKMREHSAWYSGDAAIIANYYTEYCQKNIMDLPYINASKEGFWGRQVMNQGEISVHVPIAGDIAETSANFMFSEPPMIKITEAFEKNAAQSFKDSQKELDKMLLESNFNQRILEAAEACAAIGGIYIKGAWDQDISPYPIPVIEQGDQAIPEFKFGLLTAVTFWTAYHKDEHNGKVYRLLERYERGAIRYNLYLGTGDRLGKEVPLITLDETKELVDIQTGLDEVFAVYIPNALPNRLDRNACLGRSDYLGIEGLMDSLDETFSSWIKDIALGQARILLPEQYVSKLGSKSRFNIDQSLFVKLDIDPVTEGDKITATQFDIRAEKFEKTALNLLERIITSAGYSPQSFGLNIAGRAESGTALSIRERKSFSTKSKKQAYWQMALSKFVSMMITLYVNELGGKMESEISINVAFSDNITNDMTELSTSVKTISDAIAASIDTKVRLLHPEWEEDQILDEVKTIKEENSIGTLGNPDDLGQMNFSKAGTKQPSKGDPNAT